MKSKSIAVTLALVLASAWVLCAQSPSSALYLMPAVQGFRADQLNRSLAAAGFADLPITFGSGAGGFGTVGRWRIGGEGTYFAGSASRGTTTTSIDGGLGYFYAGYLAHQKTWTFIPAVGLGFGGMNVKATRTTAATSIDQLLTSDPNTHMAAMGDGFVHTSLAVEKNMSDNLYLGLKGSYHIGLSGARTWKAEGLSNSVADPFSHWQVSIAIGFRLQ